jgi:hypothetical protein
LFCPVGEPPMTTLPVIAPQRRIEMRNEVCGTAMSLPAPSGQYRAEVKNQIGESKKRFDAIIWLTDGASVNFGDDMIGMHCPNVLECRFRSLLTFPNSAFLVVQFRT